MKFQNSRQDGQDIAPKKWGDTEGSSTKAEKNLEKSNGVRSTESVAQLSNPPRDEHYENDSGKGLSEAYSLVGFLNPSTNEAHEITRPLKASVETTNPFMKPDTLFAQKKEHNPEKRLIGKEMLVRKVNKPKLLPLEPR